MVCLAISGYLTETDCRSGYNRFITHQQKQGYQT